MDEAAFKASQDRSTHGRISLHKIKRALVYEVENHRPPDEVRQSFSPSAETRKLRFMAQASFKLRVTVVPNSIDRIKFHFSVAVTRRLKPSRATAV